jgi:hypothetical protein
VGQTVTPLPTIGDMVVGRDVAGRLLRISSHPQSDRVVLSIWQDGRCLATVRLARTDVPDVTRALVSGLVPIDGIRDKDDGTTIPELPRQSAPATVTDQVRSVTDRVTTVLATRFRRR